MHLKQRDEKDMLNLCNIVERMAEQRFVQPIEKGLLNEYNVDVE